MAVSHEVESAHPITLFYSYARKDESLRDELDKHLSQLRKGGLIAPWHDRNINAGTEWAEQINSYLDAAHIILLLISSDFLASDYCYSNEMKHALARHKEGKARVIPILLRPVIWEDAPFSYLQVLPQDAKPVTTWPNQDLAFVNIALQIRKVVKELQALHITDPAHQKDHAMGDNFQEPLRSKVSEQRVVAAIASENTHQEHVSPNVFQSLREFRHCQKKVSELKNIHNMLHEIEVQLEGLEATVKTTAWDNEQRPLTSEGTRLHTSDFKYIEISWRQAVLKMDDLGYFAIEEMKELDDERFSFDSNVIRGPSWMKELFVLRQYFEASMRNQDMEAVKRLADELLRKCRSHLYHIDKRLLDAVKELDRASDFIMRYER